MTAFLVGLFESPEALLAQVRTPTWHKAEDRLHYRGPDGIQAVNLDHARLVAANRLLGARNRGAMQPFQDPESGAWILFDGRLDAPASLARSLGLAGKASAGSDVELVAAAYRRHGSDFLSCLDGEFCTVVVEPGARRLMAGRDPLGSRAVFWSAGPTGAVLSNELPAIHATTDCGGGLDALAIADYLMHGFFGFFDKSRTPFAAIHALPPGHRLIIEGGRPRVERVRRFADLIRRSAAPKPADVPEAFNAVFREAIADRLAVRSALIPLSGGLDSSTIAAHCANQVREGASGAALTAVTGAVQGDDSEWAIASEAARQLGLAHCRTEVGNEEVFPSDTSTWFPATSFYHADRFGDPALSRSELLLTGSAGDSSFAPSHASVLSILRSFGLRSTLHALRTARAQRRRLAFGTGIGRLARMDGSDGGRLVSPHPFPDWLAPELVSELQLRARWDSNLRWMPAEPLDPRHPEPQFWLQWGNWFGGCFRLGLDQPPPEWTDPFLDSRVLSFIFSLPPEPWMHRKYLLRQAGRGMLPEAVLARPKVPAGNFIARFERARDPAILDRWLPSKELEGFVVRDKVPVIDMLREAEVGYLNLRPLMLQRWLSGLDRW